jgi:hypothetical protein
MAFEIAFQAPIPLGARRRLFARISGYGSGPTPELVYVDTQLRAEVGPAHDVGRFSLLAGYQVTLSIPSHTERYHSIRLGFEARIRRR